MAKDPFLWLRISLQVLSKFFHKFSFGWLQLQNESEQLSLTQRVALNLFDPRLLTSEMGKVLMFIENSFDIIRNVLGGEATEMMTST